MTKYEYKGHLYNASELARIAGIPAPTMHNRIRNKWDIARAVETPAISQMTTSATIKFSKTDAERFLNDLEPEDFEIGYPRLYQALADRVRDLRGSNTKRLGTALRLHFKELFEQWYEDQYKNKK